MVQVHRRRGAQPLPQAQTRRRVGSGGPGRRRDGLRVSDPTACGVRASEAVPGAARGGIPAQSVAIEITPKFLVQFLDKEYAGQFQDVEQAFFSLGSIDEFPEMRALLPRLWPRSGGPEHSELCYEGKALEI